MVQFEPSDYVGRWQPFSLYTYYCLTIRTKNAFRSKAKAAFDIIFDQRLS